MQVENRLFKVPRSTLESQSKVFRDMFSLPPPSRDLLEGSSDEKPIHLHDIKADEFKLLLRALFTRCVVDVLPHFQSFNTVLQCCRAPG